MPDHLDAAHNLFEYVWIAEFVCLPHKLLSDKMGPEGLLVDNAASESQLNVQNSIFGFGLTGEAVTVMPA